MTTYTIRDKSRSISVIGERLSSASSYEPGKSRWITFDLYRSDSGVYVLHRVGRSRVFHTSDCDNTLKNGLEPVPARDLDTGGVPCLLCRPDRQSRYVFPETDRHFSTTCGHAQGVLEFLSRYDRRTGSSYYTDVSLDLIEDAAEVDEDINFAYYGKDSVID